MKKKIILGLVLLGLAGVLINSFIEYYGCYELCVDRGHSYSGDVYCNKDTTFWEYNRDNGFLVALFEGDLGVTQFLIFSPFIKVIAILMAGTIIWKEKKKVFNDEKDNSYGEKQEIKDEGSKKQKRIEVTYSLIKKSTVKIVIGIIPFALLLIYGINNYFNGFSFFFTRSYGIDAMLGTFLFVGAIFSPVFIIALGILISGLIERKKK